MLLKLPASTEKTQVPNFLGNAVPATVPIVFRNLPSYVDFVWDTMQATRPFHNLDNPKNLEIFKKGMLILSEAKVGYAHRASIIEQRTASLYTLEELRDLSGMASILPFPLVIYLECIGNIYSNNSKQLVTPLLAEIKNYKALSGAITWAPSQLLPLLNLLRLLVII